MFSIISESAEDAGSIEEGKGYSPKFIKTLSDHEAVCGTPARLSVEVEGKPDPDVCWTVDGEEIFEDEGIAFAKEGQVHSLIFKETVEEDEGLYNCVARNSYGEVECFAKFIIIDEAIKPEFVQGVRDVEVEEGKEAKFQVEVAGTPLPDVKWMKGKMELVESEKYKVVKDGSNVSLVIRDCTEDDEGVYQIVGENSTGKVSCNAKLMIVKRIREPRIVLSKDQPSTFGLKSGERFHFDFEVNGEVTEKHWTLNGKELERSERIGIAYDNKKVIFGIEMVEESDSGVYEFIAENSNGKTVLSVTLNVEGEIHFAFFGVVI